MTATAVDERAPLPRPTCAPPTPPTSFSLTDHRRVVLADDPCEAGLPGAGPEHAGIYLHARYFDPQLGIFLSPDPTGVAGGLNQYGYALGSPVIFVDRGGTRPAQDACYEQRVVINDHWTIVKVCPWSGGATQVVEPNGPPHIDSKTLATALGPW